MIGELKPYAAYKDSGVPWLGEVPEHWEVLPLSAAFSPKLIKNLGMTEKTVLSLSYGQIIVKPPEKLHGLVPESFETYQIVDPGNIIIRTTDLQNDQVSLRVGITKHRGIITSAYLCLQTSNYFSESYGYLLLNAYDLMKIFYGYGSGLRQNLDFAHVKRMPILKPPVKEQSQIATFLDYADRLIRRYIRSKQKLIKLLEEQKQVVINQSVTRGLDPNVSLKPSGIEWLGDIPENWKLVPLKGLAHIQTGITLAKQYFDQKLQEFPYLRVANVQAGYVTTSEVKRISLPYREAQRSFLQAGDVLMTEGGDPDKLGRGCVWEGQIEPCLHQNHVFAVRPNKNRLSPRYLEALLGSKYAKNYFLRTAKQTTNLASTNKTTIGRLPVLLPKVEEQDLILNKLKLDLGKTEQALSRVHHKISLLREFRTRLIADVVTGKLDVREAAAHLPAELDEPDPLEDDLPDPELDSDSDLDAIAEDEAA